MEKANDKKTLAELKSELKALGIKNTGLKNALLDRLNNYHNGEEVPVFGTRTGKTFTKNTAKSKITIKTIDGEWEDEDEESSNSSNEEESSNSSNEEESSNSSNEESNELNEEDEESNKEVDEQNNERDEKIEDKTSRKNILSSNKIDYFTLIPRELKIMIAQELANKRSSISDILKYCSLNKKIYNICKDDNFWKMLYERRFGHEEKLPPSQISVFLPEHYESYYSGPPILVKDEDKYYNNYVRSQLYYGPVLNWKMWYRLQDASRYEIVKLPSLSVPVLVTLLATRSKKILRGETTEYALNRLEDILYDKAVVQTSSQFPANSKDNITKSEFDITHFNKYIENYPYLNNVVEKKRDNTKVKYTADYIFNYIPEVIQNTNIKDLAAQAFRSYKNNTKIGSYNTGQIKIKLDTKKLNKKK